MNKWSRLFLILSVLWSGGAGASAAVFSASVEGDFDRVYQHVYRALENHRLFVVFEPDIGANLAGFAERWGEDYNRNELERIKAMVFCNAWYANQVSNMDVSMTAMCPLHVTLTHRDGTTSVHFVRPDAVAAGTAAEEVAGEITKLVIEAITQGLRAAEEEGRTAAGGGSGR